MDLILDLKYYERQKKIRKEQYNNVYEGIQMKTGEICAIKTISKKDWSRKTLVRFCQGLKVSLKLNHPSIIKNIGYNPVDFNNKKKPVLITEFTPNGNLHDLLEDKKEISIQWNDTKKLINIFGIASAMSYLHSHNIIHRDLKPDNIFLDSNFYPKLDGFYISKEISEETFIEPSDINGNPLYISPETYKYHKYSRKSDVFNFSFIIYEIMTNEKPFIDFANDFEKINALYQAGMRPEINCQISKCYRELIEQCWSQNPEDRPIFDEIVEMLKTNQDFITENVNKAEYQQYIEMIENAKITFNSDIKYDQIDDSIKFNSKKFENRQKDLMKKNVANFEAIFETIRKEGEPYLDENIFDCYRIDEPDEYMVKVLKLNINELFKHEIVNLYREIHIISRLNHPTITSFFGYSPFDFNNEQRPVVVADSLSHDTLAQRLYDIKHKDYYKPLGNTEKLVITYGIASAMSYLHSHNIIHRDLKPDNIFLDSDLKPKLGGFCISKIIKSEEDKISSNLKGTPAYISPETYKKHEYTKKSDVYSFSLIIYELITNEKPYQEMKSAYEIQENICEHQYRPLIPITTNLTYKELIERCWSQNPEDRPTFDEIVEMLKTNQDFITENVNKAEYQQYIEKIENAKITFNSDIKYDQLYEYIKSEIRFYDKYEYDITLTGIYDTETKNIDLKFKPFNLEKFVKKKKFFDEEMCKHYEIVDKETNKSYYAKEFALSTGEVESFEEISLFIIREINVISKASHPAIVKYVGYNSIDFKNRTRPIIITEFPPNGTLENILQLQEKGQKISGWDDTKKLINIYGIASAMAYLHSYNILHLFLNPNHIFLDEYLFPKLTEFGFSRRLSNDSKTRISQIYNHYCPPEVQNSQEWRKNSDVFSFSIIVYEILTNQKTKNDYEFELLLRYGGRPEFKNTIPNCYRSMIEKCWSENPEERPSFDEIVYQLKTNPEFITETINKEEYFNYISYLDGTNVNHPFQKVNIDFTKYKKKEKLKISINMQTIDLKKFKKQEKIGRGGFGVVYKVLNKETNEINAAKISRYEIDQCENDIIVNLTREVEIISKINYPSILQFIGYTPYNFTSKEKPTIITEFAINGSLDKIIELERRSMAIPEWNDTKKLINLYGIAMGMHYIHSRKIIHRDLKPANIFLDENFYPKIGDFGLSKEINYNSNDDYKYIFQTGWIFNLKDDPKNASGFKGTLAYCAPEVLKKCEYSSKSDVYAFGMIAYEIITSSVVFEGLNQYQVLSLLTNGYRPEFKHTVPYYYRKIIEKCWSEDPNERPEFGQIVRQLGKNQDFITESIDNDEYLNYIELFDKINDKKEKKVSFTPEVNKVETTKLKSNTNNIENKLQNNNEIGNELQCYDEIFLDLTKFKKQNCIYNYDFFKVYQVIDKDTGSIFAAKISMININKISRDQAVNLSNELNIISQINHPLFLKFIGYSPIDFKKEPNPVIITELSSNGTLNRVLEMERKKLFISGWNNTKKLIIIYGIAAGMSFLHSKNIIHRDLKPQNIYLDDFLFPKIGDFGLSERFYSKDSLSYQTLSGMKSRPIYSSPEVLQHNNYSKSSDVYSFSLIVYEILTKEIPFQNLTKMNQIFTEIVINKSRPEITKNIPECYQKLITKCWSNDPNERPTFNEIEYLLRTDSSFITEGINKNDYQKYIQMIDDSKASFNLSQKVFQVDNQIDKVKEKDNSSIIKEDEVLIVEEDIYGLISEYILSKEPKKLMEFMIKNCNYQMTSSIFDKCYYEDKEFYSQLCNEGILLNNAVAHHKYAVSLINKVENNNELYKKAQFHFEESIKQGFLLSYFSLARLMHEVFNKRKDAFLLAKEGAIKGESYSKCLLGHFIANGIGTKKDLIKGVEIILKSGATDFYLRYSTEIGIYYAKMNEQNKKTIDDDYHKKAFEWFEKAYKMVKTKATINNYGICYLIGFGVQKNIEKAKEIFNEGMSKGYSFAFYHMGFIFEEIDQQKALKYYKYAADKGNTHSQFIYAYNISQKNCEDISSIDYFIKAADKGSIEAMRFLAKKYSIENDTENCYKYMNRLIHCGDLLIPLEYSINLYKSKKFKYAYYYFSLISEFNHPISKYYIAIMKFRGEYLLKDKEEAYKILKNLAENGITRAAEFIEENFL